MSQSSAPYPGCILKNYSVRSKLDCVRRCLSLTFCTGLTYTDLAPDSGSCVCLASSVQACISTTRPSGTVYINIVDKGLPGSEWLNKSCTTVADCPVKHSICYKATSTCLCTPGYYYSVNFGTCVRKCNPLYLQDTFLKYNNACIGGYQKETARGKRDEECIKLCVYSRDCLSIDYHHRGSYCHLNYHTAVTSNTFFPDCKGDPSDHYQRMCF
ncbi:uncharacterized protein LOC112566071 isoform X3 [Pomacea canaliculata]|nr:uncharacterized protein LOC112566071 isoform X3 [Pomacea canaliculata]